MKVKTYDYKGEVRGMQPDADGEWVLLDDYEKDIQSLKEDKELLLAALKLAKDGLSSVPRSLGYDITHLKHINKVIKEAEQSVELCPGLGDGGKGNCLTPAELREYMVARFKQINEMGL